MFFASPIWLLAMLPWAGVVWAVLPGRGTPAVVPALFLWKGTITRPGIRGRRRPPLPIALLLMSALLAILAAAQPCQLGKTSVTENVSIILDRGATMAVDSQHPFRGVLARCKDRLGPIPANVRVMLIPVPGQAVKTSGDQWLAAAEQMSPTVVRTDLDQAIEYQLRSTPGPVIVLSDQNLARSNARLMQIAPAKAGDAVAITLVSARTSPTAPRSQVMVRIENHSDRRSIGVVVVSGDQKASRDVMLPARGESTDAFFDLDHVSASVTAALVGETGPWSQGFAAQQGSGLRIATDAELDESIQKITAVYAADRPAAVDAPQVMVTARPLGDQQSGIWIQAGTAGGLAQSPVVVDSPVTRKVHSWPKAGPATIPAGFDPLVSTPSGVMVAIRNLPKRAVWLNAQLADWEKTEDFVIFFANTLDWLAGDPVQFTATSPTQLGGDWKPIGPSNHSIAPGEWPGIYQSGNSGKLVAVNAGAYPALDQASDSPAPAMRESGLGMRPLYRWFTFTALACCLAAFCLFARLAKTPAPVL